MPHIDTCTPAEMRDLFLATGDPTNSFYLVTNEDGSMWLQPALDVHSITEDSGGKARSWSYAAGSDRMPLEEAVADDIMSVFIADARRFQREDNQRGTQPEPVR